MPTGTIRNGAHRTFTVLPAVRCAWFTRSGRWCVTSPGWHHRSLPVFTDGNRPGWRLRDVVVALSGSHCKAGAATVQRAVLGVCGFQYDKAQRVRAKRAFAVRWGLRFREKGDHFR